MSYEEEDTCHMRGRIHEPSLLPSPLPMCVRVCVYVCVCVCVCVYTYIQASALPQGSWRTMPQRSEQV